MPRRPICDRLRGEANSNNWSEILILYCRQSSGEDIELARQLIGLCGRLLNVTRERASFILELESVGNNYAQRTAEYLREVQGRDDQKVMQMRILAAELELNARNNEIFIQRLKGLLDF